MSYRYVLIDRDDNVAILTINRSEKLNAMNAEVVADISAALDELRDDDAVHAIIIAGAGEKAFMAGADIGMLMDVDSPLEGVAVSRRGQAVTLQLEKLPKPVIVALHGYTLGGGLELALACDIRIAADNTMLGLPEMNLGIAPGCGGSQRLPRIVGKGMAKLLIFTGDMIDSEEALRIGLVEKVVPVAELMDEAKLVARKLAAKSPLAMAAAKEIINLGMEVDLESGLAIESLGFGVLCMTEDCKEGCSAFLEKRKPTFKGR